MPECGHHACTLQLAPLGDKAARKQPPPLLSTISRHGSTPSYHWQSSNPPEMYCRKDGRGRSVTSRTASTPLWRYPGRPAFLGFKRSKVGAGEAASARSAASEVWHSPMSLCAPELS